MENNTVSVIRKKRNDSHTKWIRSAVDIRNGEDPDDVVLLTQQSVNFYCKLTLSDHCNLDSPIDHLSIRTCQYHSVVYFTG